MDQQCGAFLVMNEPWNTSKIENRIDRIASLRDVQRDSITESLRQDNHKKDSHDMNANANGTNGVIILFDSDLTSLDTVDKTRRQVRRLMTPRRTRTNKNYQTLQSQSQSQWPDVDYDAICAAGVECGNRYYDSFATVWLPNTFLFPLRWRLFSKHAQKEENPHYIMLHPSKEEHVLSKPRSKRGGLVQTDIVSWLTELQQQQQLSHHTNQNSQSQQNHTTGRPSTSIDIDSDLNNEHEPVEVRSCFGGLTLYRLDTWLNPSCRYYDPQKTWTSDADPLLRYAKKSLRRPCEHVSFHECLRQHDSSFHIGIQPALQPNYHSEKKCQKRRR
jgi:hypothetical protein